MFTLKNPNHSKYAEQRAFYNSFKGKKCSYELFRARFTIKGIPLEQAISPLHLQTKAKRVNENGRECTKCSEFKHWTLFSKMSNGINGYSTDCLDCRNKKHRKERENKELKERENEYKRNRRANEEGKIKTFLDNIYYQDPKIMKNREILKSVNGKIDKKKSVESKIEWLINKGYDSELLEKLYNIKVSYVSTFRADTRY